METAIDLVDGHQLILSICFLVLFLSQVLECIGYVMH